MNKEVLHNKATVWKLKKKSYSHASAFVGKVRATVRKTYWAMVEWLMCTELIAQMCAKCFQTPYLIILPQYLQGLHAVNISSFLELREQRPWVPVDESVLEMHEIYSEDVLKILPVLEFRISGEVGVGTGIFKSH